MCNVSMVMDQWSPYIPQRWPPPPMPPAPRPQPVVDPAELRELLDAFREAVKAAEVFDRLTGQPDCVDPEKAELVERVAELEAKLDAIAKEAAA